MTLYTADTTKAKRGKAKAAIALALESRWEEAAAANRMILEACPSDMEACNRLGKALTELGRYEEAEEAFRQSLRISRSNMIARKNLKRLSLLKGASPQPKGGAKVPLKLFIEESGKTATASLINLSPTQSHLRMAPGDAVELKASAGAMTVESLKGEYLGGLEPKLASRLAKLITCGNRYASAALAVNEWSLAIIIKETYQHPSQQGKVSFPSRAATDEMYAYLRTPLPFDLEQDEKEETPDRPPITGWENNDGDGEASMAVPRSNEDEEEPIPKEEIED